MEASSALRRCVSRISHRSRSCKNSTTSTRLISPSQHRTWINQTSSRSFASTSTMSQDGPLQSQRPSQSRTRQEAANANTTTTNTPPSTDRIDLSTLPDISPPGPMSASEKLDLLLKPRTGAPSPREDRFKRTLRQTSPNSTTDIDIASLLDNLNTSPTRPLALQESRADVKLALRLRPALGRTQIVDPVRNMDLTRAMRSLEIKCAQNNIKRDLKAQRFHVRKGQQRKMTRSIRWRNAFKQGFLEECARIRRMKNQGW